MNMIHISNIEHISGCSRSVFPTFHWLKRACRLRLLRLRDRLVPWQLRHFYYRHEVEAKLGVGIAGMSMGVAFGHLVMVFLCFCSRLLGLPIVPFTLPIDALPASAMFVPGLSSLARRMSLSRSNVLYHGGESANELMILADGYGRLCMEQGDGRCLTVGLVAPGDLFGEEAFLDVPERESTFEAVLNCQIEIVPREVFIQFVNDNPRMLRIVTEHLAQRLLTQQRHMALLAFEPLERRLAWILLALATATKTLAQDEPIIPIYHKDLAAILGVWRETITATMNRWANEGLIVQHSGQIELKDMSRLRKMADEANR